MKKILLVLMLVFTSEFLVSADESKRVETGSPKEDDASLVVQEHLGLTRWQQLRAGICCLGVPIQTLNRERTAAIARAERAEEEQKTAQARAEDNIKMLKAAIGDALIREAKAKDELSTCKEKLNDLDREARYNKNRLEEVNEVLRRIKKDLDAILNLLPHKERALRGHRY